MPNTKRFKELSKRLTELKKHLLPSKFSATGDYTDRQIDRARGYRLLVHAEIEVFLEDSARELVTKKVSAWKKQDKPSQLLIAFLACYHSGWATGEERSDEEIMQLAKRRAKVKDSVKEIINIAQKQYIEKIKNNHGVREKNLKMIILPTGIEVDDLDPTWVTDLNEFGKLRGDVAHQSKKTSGGLNPEDEYKRVNGLLKGLKELDRKIFGMLYEQ